MAGRQNPSFLKRQKEQKRLERANAKRAARQARRAEKANRGDATIEDDDALAPEGEETGVEESDRTG